MDQLAFHESTNPFCPVKDDHLEDLLEHLWFYGNIASLNPMSGRSREDIYASIKRDDNEESWPPNLVRAPSLRDQEKGTLDEEITEDEESEFSMANLIRQASLSNPESFSSRRPLNKGLTGSSNISRHGSITKLDSDKLKGSMKTRPQGQMSQLKMRKSMNDLEMYKELQWFWLVSEIQRPVVKRSNENIKAHIKFWARAVASSVRQES